jgi:two-component system sensor histidine kinase ChvG
LIEQSLDKLDGLVISARRLDTAAADLLDTPRTDVDLSALVRRVLDAHSELFRQCQLNKTAGVIQDGIIVRGGEDMIETVIENVLENAVSFSSPGGNITTTLAVVDGEAVLAIEDEGPGVPPANLGRIFDRYYSSRPSKSDTGIEAVHFGVGLSIVRRNTEALGGHVIVENREPTGLRLKIILPLKPGSGRVSGRSAAAS